MGMPAIRSWLGTYRSNQDCSKIGHQHCQPILEWGSDGSWADVHRHKLVYPDRVRRRGTLYSLSFTLVEGAAAASMLNAAAAAGTSKPAELCNAQVTQHGCLQDAP